MDERKGVGTMGTKSGFILGALFLALLVAAPPGAPAASSGRTVVSAPEQVDLEAVHRIKEEGFQRSQVMENLYALTDANGPRVTNSPGFRSAADWAVKTLKSWGLSDPRLETWGRFGRGWDVVHFRAEMTSPAYAVLRGVPRAWSGDTGGPARGEVILAPFATEREDDEIRADLARYRAQVDRYAETWRGKLRGKYVLVDPLRKLDLPVKPAVERYDAQGLDKLLAAPEPRPVPPIEWPIEKMPADEEARRALSAALPGEITADYGTRRLAIVDRLNAFLKSEQVLGVIDSDKRGPGGIVFAERAGSWYSDTPTAPPTIVLESESYNRLVRLAQHGPAPKVEIDLETRFYDDNPDAFNVVAEIPGGAKKGEIVMLGAHLDSWHGGTGATDNAAGCAVVLEAARILKTLNLPLDRTVRLALWSGEEQGLLGSRGYVKNHFADPVTMALKPEHARLSGYFNLDNGAGKIRGVYLQGNDAMRPVFEAWLAPFRDLGVEAISIRNTFGTDHKPFDAVGLPAFQFIQDPLDYETRTHHSDMDVADRVPPGDLMQAAVVMAACVYDAANRPAMLPRKPLPPPLPPKKPIEGEKTAQTPASSDRSAAN
ncbi:MAG TPA: M20/M25/M40 family metallo-hydrolase [Candidatus Polarisedimenticolia bacterium]|nr:M20/M25/M40 family metallo-hydrolase [Candidatus Polarisedimenticolia bacterium]